MKTNLHIILRSSFLILFATVAMAVMAVPAKRGVWKTVKLADGTEVRAELRGDEYMNYWQTADGRQFVKAADKPYYVAADMQALRENAVKMRMENPLPQPLGERSMVQTQDGKQRVAIGGSHPEFVGEKKGLIILVEFTDQKFQEGHNAEYYSHMANDLNFSHPDGHVGSIRDYFLAQSEGKFDLTFDVVGPIQLKYDMEYYGGHSGSSNDKNARAMIIEAVNGAATQLGTFAPYDWFADAYVDQVFVIYAGLGEAGGGGDNTIWPHRSGITTMTVGGKRVSTYACANEMQNETTIDGIGTFCHEFSHCLGLADLYDINYGAYNNGKEYYGMGQWDVMDGGCYLGNGFRPCSYSGYERNYCNWKEPVILTDDAEITNVKGISEGGDYYIIYNDAYKDEYYILENRTSTGWDTSLWGSGLLITHIDFDQSLWSSNMVNTYVPNRNDHPRYTPFLADNDETQKTVAQIRSDLYPYGANNELTNTSIPAATLYNANSDGEYFMSKPVTNITRNSDNTISFTFKNMVGKEEENDMPEGCIFRETFNKSCGKGGNDGSWTNSGATSEFKADNDGWTLTNYGAGDKCVRLGTSSQKGMITTPEIELNGDYELAFLAAPWTGEASSITLSITSGTATLSKSTFSLTAGQWTDCRTKLSGTGKVKIRFTANAKRFFFDEVFITELNASAIQTPTLNTPNSTLNTPNYNLAGQRVNNNYRGIVIRNGKKLVVK